MESLTSRFNFTAERAAHFDELQKKLAPLWRLIGRTNPGGEVQDENTLVVLPSLTADIDMSGSAHKIYEERFLFMTFLLRQPHLRMIYLTSQPVSPLTIEYYLHSLPDVTVSNARKRLFLLSPQDASNRSLVEKVLERPWFVRHILDLIPNPDLAHLVPFLTTDLERELALQLDIPMYAADPRHYALGGKSGARRICAVRVMGRANAIAMRGKATMPCQKEAAPTAPGMRSEPSKRNSVSSLCRISIDCSSSGLEATLGSRPLLALMTPPRLTRLFAHRSLER